MNQANALKRILVVEDEQRYRELLFRLLDELGWQCAGARTGVEALEACGAGTFDAIMLDLNLPVMDGLEFMQALRSRGDDTPVIILSAHGTLASAQEAIRLGVADFLTKPCHLGDIERALARACSAEVKTLPKLDWGEDEPERASDAPPTTMTQSTNGGTLAKLERRAIAEALKKHGGNKSAAAEELGISRRTLYNRLEAYEGRS